MSGSDFLGLIIFIAALVSATQWWRYRKHFKNFSSVSEAVDSKSKELIALENQAKNAEDRADSAEKKLAETASKKEDVSKNIEQLEINLKELEKAESAQKLNVNNAKQQTEEINRQVDILQTQLRKIKIETNDLSEQRSGLEKNMTQLIELSNREQTIYSDVKDLEISLAQLQEKKKDAQLKVNALMERLDLYSRLDEFACVGHFDVPDYLYGTSERYQAEINAVRDAQRKLIKDKTAITHPDELLLCTDPAVSKRILAGQTQLMLNAFNIDCDLLIGKVGPSNFPRTLEQIEKKAEALEKSCATLKCGFNLKYVELKFEECKLQYEFELKKKDEQEEQRLIREQMREEVRVQKQYEEAAREAEKEELKFMRLLEKARGHLSQENEQERALSLAKIELLEEQLQEAQERGIRAKSMAEQTRRGYVYVISNIGSFGEGVYKIGLTRRLDPQDRVDELGDASVPFQFDVHAMCYSEDAPALETALHRRFSDRRVNSVNLRKEFFQVELHEIQNAIEEIVGSDVEFTTTSKATEYFESKRLLSPLEASEYDELAEIA